MAIQRAGGTNRNDLYVAVASKSALNTNWRTTLLAAGWTETEAVKALGRLTGTGDPANNDTVTLDGKVYTFKTTINNANDGEVTRGVSLADSLSNLNAAINLGAGAGTAYSTATTLHSTIESFGLTATTLDVRAKTGGPTGNRLATTEASANLSFAHTAINFGGYKFLSALTPEKMRCQAYIFSDSATNSPASVSGRIILYNEEGAVATHTAPTATTVPDNSNSAYGTRYLGSGVDVRIIANKYQFFYLQNNVTGSTQYATVHGGVPWLPDFQKPKVVTAASNSTPISITTSAAHGYSTGYVVTVRGVGGNTAANVTSNAITVTGATTFTLDGTVGNGTYTSGGRVARDNYEIYNAVWMIGSSTGVRSLRSRLHQNNAAGESQFILNSSSVDNTAGVTGTGNPALVIPVQGFLSDGGDELLWFNQTAVVSEPLIGWSTAVAAQFWLIGQLWDAVVTRKALTRDLTGTFDGNNWWNFTDNNIGDTGNAEGSLLLIVP